MNKKIHSELVGFERTLLLSYCVLINADLKDVVAFEKWVRKSQLLTVEGIDKYRLRRVNSFAEGFLALAPVNCTGYYTKLLICKNTDDCLIVFTNHVGIETDTQYEIYICGGSQLSCPAASRIGCKSLGISYTTKPWSYDVVIFDSNEEIRGIRARDWGESKVHYGKVGEPFPFEDREALKRLKRGEIIGIEEIRKYTDHFGFLLPLDPKFPMTLKEIALVEFPNVFSFTPLQKRLEKEVLMIPDYDE